MKVYVLVTQSVGQDGFLIDSIEIFKEKEKTIKNLEKHYKDVIDDVKGYEIIDEWLDNRSFLVQIDDEYESTYEGYVYEKEIK